MKPRGSLLFVTLLISVLLFECGDDIKASDYSIPVHWLNTPPVVDKAVDVFYLYPTAYIKVNADVPNVGAIDNPAMIKGSINGYACQATAFEIEL
jgi:hypothetical protein